MDSIDWTRRGWKLTSTLDVRADFSFYQGGFRGFSAHDSGQLLEGTAGAPTVALLGGGAAPPWPARPSHTGTALSPVALKQCS